jgi:hypothetical protein
VRAPTQSGFTYSDPLDGFNAPAQYKSHAIAYD